MPRYGSGRKYAYVVAERLQVEPGLFVDAMMAAGMALTAFDKLNEESAQVDHVQKSVAGRCLTGLYALQLENETPEIAESIARLEARGYTAS